MNILDFNLEELKLWMVENNESGFRAKQVFDWIYKGIFEFDLMKNLPQNTKAKLIDNFEIALPVILQTLISEKDGTRKYLLKYQDGNIIEAVIMRYSYGNSICISTQIGCRMGCTFCASTIEGRVRDLSSGEMLAEVLVLQKDLEDRISNIVLMGSGEPLDNYCNVIKFIKTSNDKYGLSIGQRHITLSTCGIVPKIYELAEEELQITLAISLHAPDDLIRQQSMPIAKRYPIDELINACKFYIKKTNRRITFEYALIKDFNDGIDNAKKLSNLLNGLLCHVNLIPLNEVVERDYKKTDKRNIEDFQKILMRNGIEVTLRREMGADINAACGQLRRSYIKDSELS